MVDERFYDDWAGLGGPATLLTFERQDTGREYVWSINVTLILSIDDATYTSA
ncbi:hypothetical protein [Ornithinimicrobium sediminis]|uniref:hypothetical protein n=1 Tax=Ornithinimicrobium sediminis TaxID=2904603 RepID=UPI001E4C19A8|nr:hypothetical protein [Ornithinimicrobium sediminis]MCE0485690.1 hypothetical protein [Ornithinimicrobium sediminis]